MPAATLPPGRTAAGTSCYLPSPATLAWNSAPSCGVGITVPEQSGDTNWLLDNHPDLYAYAVAEKVAEFYLEDLETADKYMARFDRAIEALDEVEKTAFIPRGAHVYHTRRPISRFSLAHRI